MQENNRTPDGKEIWAQPEPPCEMVWAICSYVEGRNLEPCKQCPEWEDDKNYGKVQLGCYGMAAEACRIVFAMQARAADDADVIIQRRKELKLYHERRCFKKHGLKTEDCWCFKAAENGVDHLPCASANTSE